MRCCLIEAWSCVRLFSQVVYEHDEDVSSHLALLCHVCLLLADHEEHLVAVAAQQLLVNCLYSLSHHHKELMQEEHKQVDTTQASARTAAAAAAAAALFPKEDSAQELFACWHTPFQSGDPA